MDNTTVLNVSARPAVRPEPLLRRRGNRERESASAFRSTFGDDYGVKIADGPLAGLFARAVVVVDADGTVTHTQLVPEIGSEPDYDAALAALA